MNRAKVSELAARRFGTGLIAFLFALVLGWSSAFAQSYCVKPNGIAVRTVAHEQLRPFFDLMNSRFPGDNILYVVKVPPEVQLEPRFHRLENAALAEQMDSNEAFQQTIVEARAALAAQGTHPSDAELKAVLLKQLSEPRTAEQIRNSDHGLVYLYSNNLEVLKHLDPDLATSEGLVVEGSKAEIEDLIGGIKQQDKDWWADALGSDVDSVVAVGFDAPKTVPELLGGSGHGLRVSSWADATSPGSAKLKALFDAKAENSLVINLFPTNADQAKPWKYADALADQYVQNGVRMQSDYEGLGYTVQRFDHPPSPTVVLDAIRQQAAAGKKVLLIAETTTLPDGSGLLRVPGLEEGISVETFQALGAEVLEHLFVVSCNSQNLSAHLPLAIIGTIYTDSAKKLVRLTFAAGEADSLSGYLEYNLEAVAKVWTDVVAAMKSSAGLQEGGAPPGFVAVASIYRITMPTAAAALPAVGPGADDGSDDVPVKPSGTGTIYLYLTGLLGAICREGLRWKQLVEQRKAKRYLKLPYLLLSAALALLAGAVAVVFSRMSPDALILPVAFVAGAGFEKIVQMAAKLKVWQPTAAVPMGTPQDADAPTAPRPPGQARQEAPSLLGFLRHGDT